MFSLQPPSVSSPGWTVEAIARSSSFACILAWPEVSFSHWTGSESRRSVTHKSENPSQLKIFAFKRKERKSLITCYYLPKGNEWTTIFSIIYRTVRTVVFLGYIWQIHKSIVKKRNTSLKAGMLGHLKVTINGNAVGISMSPRVSERSDYLKPTKHNANQTNQDSSTSLACCRYLLLHNQEGQNYEMALAKYKRKRYYISRSACSS